MLDLCDMSMVPSMQPKVLKLTPKTGSRGGSGLDGTEAVAFRSA
jgi:hypothetical protein